MTLNEGICGSSEFQEKDLYLQNIHVMCMHSSLCRGTPCSIRFKFNSAKRDDRIVKLLRNIPKLLDDAYPSIFLGCPGPVDI